MPPERRGPPLLARVGIPKPHSPQGGGYLPFTLIQCSVTYRGTRAREKNNCPPVDRFQLGKQEVEGGARRGPRKSPFLLCVSPWEKGEEGTGARRGPGITPFFQSSTREGAEGRQGARRRSQVVPLFKSSTWEEGKGGQELRD